MSDAIELYKELVSTIKEIAGNSYLYFERGIHAKITTFCAPFEMWGVCVSPEDAIYVMDSSFQWHLVEDCIEDQRILMRLYRHFHLNVEQSFNHL